MSHSLQAREPEASLFSDGVPQENLSVEVKSGSPRYRITRVLHPKAWLKAMFKRGRTERFCVLTELTPELYAAMSEHNTHNRKVHRQKVEEIAQAIQDDAYILTPDYIAFDYVGTLINGQHRGEAVRAAEDTIPVTIWFGCEKMEFEVIDKGKRRSPADVLNINGYDFPAQRAFLARMSIVVKNNAPYAVIPDRALEAEAKLMAEENGPDVINAIDYGKQIERAKPRMYGVSATSAGFACYYILKHTKQPHDVVWDFLDGLKTGSPNKNILSLRAKLSDIRGWLVSTSLDENNNPVDRKDSGWSRRDANTLVAAAIILCWNRYSSTSSRDKNHAPQLGFGTWSDLSNLPEPN